jgi:hypothetical protein
MAKSILFSFLMLIGLGNCFAQDLIKRTRKITPEVTEKYMAIIGADREIKQGLYQALYNKKIPIAVGKYTDDKRTGTWQYFNKRGEPIQRYNYDTNTLQLETREDETSNMSYEFDLSPNETDRLTKPIKIGGRYYGYLPYLKCFELPRDMREEDLSMYYVILELLISPGGRLAEYKIHIKTPWDNDYDRVININPNRLFDDDKKFIPATLNGDPVSARIMINCFIKSTHTLDTMN